MELSIHNISGKKTSKIAKLNDSVFAVEPNDHAIYLDVKQYMANNRQGTHKSKERAEINGSTRKVKKQKGTGTARMGSIKSPVLRGGGRAFGPRPKDYSFKLNKKLKQVARKSALTYKAKEEALLVLEDFNMKAPKTKEYVAILDALKVTGERTLLVLAQADVNIYRSATNLSNTDVTTVAELNTYDILKAKRLLLCEGAIKEIETILS